jgi:hypothetical protein
MSGLGAGYVWPGGQTCLARVSGIRLGADKLLDRSNRSDGVQYQSERCDRF